MSEVVREPSEVVSRYRVRGVYHHVRRFDPMRRRVAFDAFHRPRFHHEDPQQVEGCIRCGRIRESHAEWPDRMGRLLLIWFRSWLAQRRENRDIINRINARAKEIA